MLPKVEEQVGVRLQEPWQEDYLQQYHNFANTFRVNRWSETWDVMEFFQQLKMLQLYCDHLGLLYCSKWDLPKNKTMWCDCPKIVHLITDLKKHLESEQGGKITNGVAFSQWTAFLDI